VSAVRYQITPTGKVAARSGLFSLPSRITVRSTSVRRRSMVRAVSPGGPRSVFSVVWTLVGAMWITLKL
jgi:hypothetical protein